MISVPRGVLRLAALKMLSESSMSGIDLAREIGRVTGGEWRPGPGSIYPLLGQLRKKGLITELSKREGTVRRYIISAKGKAELARLSQQSAADVARQLKLLSAFSALAGRSDLQKKVGTLVESLSS